MKKIFVFLILLICSIGISAQTEITFWYGFSDEREKVLVSEVKYFESQNPDIKVNLKNYGNPDEVEPKIIKALNENRAPELFWWGPQATGKMAKTGKLLKAEEFIKNDSSFNKDDIYEGLWEVSKYKGEIWTLPFDANNLAVYYNKDYFEKEGIKPENITNWGAFLRAASKLTKDTNNDGTPERYGFMIPYGNTEWTVWTWQTFLWAAGGEFIDTDGTEKPLFNSGAGIKALALWNKMVYEDKSAYLCEKNKGYDITDFINGKTAMVINGPWNYQALKKQNKVKVGVMHIPADLRKATNIGGENLYIFKSDKIREEASWRFAKYIMSRTFQKTWAMETGYIPVCKSVKEDAVYREFLDKNDFLNAYVENMRYGKARPTIPEYNYISFYLGKQIEYALSNNLSPDRALENGEEFAEIMISSKF